MTTASEATSVQIVTRWVDAEVRSGGLSAGQRLIESDIARQLGVSRNSVREAMQRLAGMGFVVIERNRGPVLRTLTRREVDELYEIRERLEGLAARRAAVHAAHRSAELAGLHAIAATAATSGDVLRYAAANTAFHEWIMAAAESVWLTETSARLNLPIFRLQFRVLLSAEALKVSSDQHARIVAAIALGREDEAESEMQLHIQGSRERVRLLASELFRKG